MTAAVRSRRPVPRAAPAPRSAALPICLLMVIATVPWRPGQLYSGGVDPVVAAKALLSAAALAMAWHLRLRCATPQPARTLGVWLLVGYLSISLFGAWASSFDVISSLILAIRIAMLGTIVILLARTFPAAELIRAWITALASVGLFAAVTGLPTLASGRLGGGIPAMHPNELAMLCGYGLIGLAWLGLHGRARGRHGALMLFFLAALWATGSRAALGGAIVAIGIMAIQARRVPRLAMTVVVMALAGVVYVATATTMLSSFFLRGGEQNVTTLSSRTIAWSAAFDYSDDPWVRWLGAGLAKKEIPVVGQYWQTQVLESSWISALVHAGRIGALLLIGWAVWVLLSMLRAPREQRMVLTAVFALIMIRSFLESGLVDSSTVFITFFILSVVPLGADGGTRTTRERARSTSGPVGRRSGHVAPVQPLENVAHRAAVAR